MVMIQYKRMWQCRTRYQECWVLHIWLSRKQAILQPNGIC